MRSATPRRYASPTSRWRPSTSQPTHGILNGIIRSAHGHPYDALILERLLSRDSWFDQRKDDALSVQLAPCCTDPVAGVLGRERSGPASLRRADLRGSWPGLHGPKAS